VAQLDHVVNSSPLLTVSGQVIYDGQNWSTSIRGVDPAYQTIQNWQIAEGTWFDDQAEQSAAPVAVLGQTVVQNLFAASATDPIGQTIRINSQLFHVIGMLQAKGSQGPADADDVIFVPVSTANERLKASPLYVNQIQLQVDDANNVAQVEQEITTLLRARHHLRGPAPSQGQPTGGFGAGGLAGGLSGGNGGRGAGGGGNSTSGQQSSAVSDPNDFQVSSGNQLVQTAQQNTFELTILLISIAAISLSIGGIGIMNIMLVSVTERTREIGVLIGLLGGFAP
jgi:putative ABC transport system permease protein